MEKERKSDRLPSSFGWLNITQFLGAFNDNAFRWLVFLLLVGLVRAGEEGAPSKSAVMANVTAVFVIPFLLFSHAAGILADRISKRNIIVFSKFMEAAVMALGCIAIIWAQPIALYAVIFLMAFQSTMFGPSKFGIIPELVGRERLSKANGFLTGASYLAIIMGTFVAPFLLEHVVSNNYLMVGLFCVAFAILGSAVSLKIPVTAPVRSGKKFTPFFIREVIRTLWRTRRDRHLFLAIMGASYFLFLGGFIQQNIVLFGEGILGLSWMQSVYLFPVAAFGIGLGAISAGKLSGRNIEFGIVPIGAFGLTLACVLLSVADTMRSVIPLVFVIGFSTGLYLVPLNAFIQFKSPERDRGEILACVNFLSFIGVLLSAGTVYFLGNVLNLQPDKGFLIVGLLTALLFVACVFILPDFLVRFVIVLLTRLIYRIRVLGGHNVPIQGGALLVANHVTWVDALLLGATQQRRIRFVMARDIYDIGWMRPLFKLMRVIPISPTDPPRQIATALQEARIAINDGDLVCIFAEGGVTRNGNMRAFRAGFEKIVKKTGCPILPTYIGGAWGSMFSYYYGKLLARTPTKIPYPVTIIFGKAMPASSSKGEVRDAVVNLSVDYFDSMKRSRKPLAAMFVCTARRNWNRHAMNDTTGKSLTYGKALVGSAVLAEKIEMLTEGQRNVGILLPASVAGALVNVAVNMLGKVSVNLNFTASADAFESAITQADIRTVISSRAFVEQLKDFVPPDGTVYMEDIAAGIGYGDKLRALLGAVLTPWALLKRRSEFNPDDPATVIFSSGSTGMPKGVMLSHHNIISNIESFGMVFRFVSKDNICGVLPFFHSFGFTCSLWCPIVSGFSACYHPNPLDGAKVAEVVRENRSTVLISTPTFLLTYIRKAKKEDFVSLRAVLTGAEKLKPRVADSFEKKLGIRPREGYGTTELSPVVSLSVADVTIDGVSQVGTKEGSIGHPLPGVAARIVDIETEEPLPIGQEGLLLIRGPNVMLGYIGQPEKTAEALKDGWYNTGDIARIDDDGFITITDRLARFSKIGGEMVPHLAIEDCYMDALGGTDHLVAVTSIPDEKKGEKLVVLHVPDAGDAESLHEIIKNSDLPNLWKPRKENHLRIEAMPLLGSGKLDLSQIRQLAKDAAAIGDE